MKGIVIPVLVALVQFMVMPGEALDCGQVASSLAPCMPYLTGTNTSPSASCCTGVKNLVSIAPTTADKRAACDCIKAAASRYPLKEDAASTLPKKCGVVTNIPISKNTNCQNIN